MKRSEITLRLTTDSTSTEEEEAAPQGSEEAESPLKPELLLLSMQATLFLPETDPSLKWLGTTMSTISSRIVRRSLGGVDDVEMVIISLLFVSREELSRLRGSIAQ